MGKKDETAEERAARKAAKKANETADERTARKAAAKNASKGANSPEERQPRSKASRSSSPASPASPASPVAAASPKKKERETQLQKDFENKNQRSHDRQRAQASPLKVAATKEQKHDNPLKDRGKNGAGSPKRGRGQDVESPPAHSSPGARAGVGRRSGSMERPGRFGDLALPKVAPPPAASPPKMKKALPAPKFDDGTVTRKPIVEDLPDDKKSIAQIKREMRDLDERIKAIPLVVQNAFWKNHNSASKLQAVYRGHRVRHGA